MTFWEFFYFYFKLGMFSLWHFFSKIIIKYRKQFPFIQKVLLIVSTFFNTDFPFLFVKYVPFLPAFPDDDMGNPCLMYMYTPPETCVAMQRKLRNTTLLCRSGLFSRSCICSLSRHEHNERPLIVLVCLIISSFV